MKSILQPRVSKITLKTLKKNQNITQVTEHWAEIMI